jgi:asparagine synthase (glutamine-hydrolysing)
MCGIAGFYLREDREDHRRLLEEMCGLIRHRGPDDEGFHFSGGCALGMRRLSIIDLSTGHQPISNEDGTVWIVFNGEIYDYQGLRRRLEAQGHVFRTRSDTETIVHLYEQEGVAGLQHLRGMFAIALWDSRSRRLLLARDRFGKKPLYYAALPHGFYFGSELKCLLAAGIPTAIDEEALRLYFLLSYIPDPWSPFLAAKKLAPGTWLTLDAAGRIEQGAFWRMPAPSPDPAPGDTPEAAAARIRETFDEAVRIRMIADVPLGAFLSGGLDSSSVVASMALQSPEPVKTFSIGFEEAGFNELPQARLVARKFGTEHHEILVKPDSVALVERLVRHFDEPFGDASAIPTFIVSRFAARHVKVVLTGDGGDEIFGGYESQRSALQVARFDRIPAFLRRGIGWIAESLPYSAYGKNFLRMVSRDTALERYFEKNYAFHFLRRKLLLPDWQIPGDTAALRGILSHFLLPNGADPLAQALFFEATANLAGDMLVKVDRMSMANSLEVRCPLLDHKLAEQALALPHAWKIQGSQGKRIFLRAVGDRLPPELLRLPKKGFGVPLARWFRGELRSFLWDHLTSEQFLGRGIVSGPFVRALLEEHDSGRRDNNHWLWSLLMLEQWFRGLGSPAFAGHRAA